MRDEFATPVTHGEFEQLAAAFWRSDQARGILRQQHYDSLDGVPLGVGMPYFGSATAVRKDYLLAYGQDVPTALYPDLSAMFLPVYGAGVLAGHFKMPDLRGRSPHGLDDMGGTDAGRLSAANTLGGTGGSETILMADMPSHNHGGATGAAGAHSHTLSGGTAIAGTQAIAQVAAGAAFAAINTWGTTDDPGNHTHTITAAGGGTLNTSGQAGGKMPPYILTNWIIKALRYPR